MVVVSLSIVKLVSALSANSMMLSMFGVLWVCIRIVFEFQIEIV